MGVGGYVCTPMYLAAKSLGVPIVIHEANTKAGLANKVGARYTTFVGTAFAATKIRNAHLVGMPMRKAVATLDRDSGPGRSPGTPGPGRRAANLDRHGRFPWCLAHQQGSGRLARGPRRRRNPDAAHHRQRQVGTRAQRRAADRAAYRQVEYVDAMEDVYAAADLLLCRSGAGTVSEVAAVGLPAVFVPLPIGNGEQARNAAELVAADAALLVPDAELDAAMDRPERDPLCLDARPAGPHGCRPPPSLASVTPPKAWPTWFLPQAGSERHENI